MRTPLALAAVACTAAAVLVPASSAQAAPAIRITKVWFDSPGPDHRTNKSLNGEWVTIKNFSGSARSLKGWTLRDQSRHVYVFGTFTLKPGKTVKIKTGSGKDTAATLYQDRRAYVWNNGKDAATLRNKAGSKIDSCAWTGKGDWKAC